MTWSNRRCLTWEISWSSKLLPEAPLSARTVTLFNSKGFRRHKCCGVNRYVIFVLSAMDVGRIRLVLLTEGNSWFAPLDKRPRTGHRTDGWQRTQYSHALLYLWQRPRGRLFGYRKSTIGTPPLVVLFRKAKSTTQSNAQGLDYGCVGIGVVLFVLDAAIAVMIDGDFCDMNSEYLLCYLHSSFAANRT